MPLSWNEIKDRALKFSHEWEHESSEKSEAQTFWNEFFEVFGIHRRRVATFEKPIKKSDGAGGFVDLLWKGILVAEHKSRGKDLTRAYKQATDYFPGIKENDLPRYILVSDFARFRLYDLEENKQHEFPLRDLYKNVRRFGFIAGYQTTSYKEQDPVNIDAAERMGKLHDKLKECGYCGHELEVYLVRLLFCLFAEDTSIFERRQFQDLIEQRTAEDGQDLAHWLADLFQILDTPPDKRLKKTDEQLSAFPYVNGSLFVERLSIAAFDSCMRQLLLDCCVLDWSRISPAIFGSLFQSVMDEGKRRNLGAHYTTEKNILKLIGPLFLDELRAEFERLKTQPRRLAEFHHRIAELKFMDPACGCGNFLVIAYRELRELELDILRILAKGKDTRSLEVSMFEILCDVDQFYGIEIEEFPVQIARTALWLMDHQMNMKVSEEFGTYFVRLPLRKSATIVHGNALRIDWREIVRPEDLNYILGNPPFGGKQYQTEEQKADMASVLKDVPGAGVLDFVSPWYRKAADYMKKNPAMKTAFVSTNSITQGEQVAVLWADLLGRNVKIHFAHRTFQWSSEARGRAAVHCVIIGFALYDIPEKRLFDYETLKAEPHEIKVKNINPYLVDTTDILVGKRRKTLQPVPQLVFGSMPNDGGNLLLTKEERSNMIKNAPAVALYIKRFMGSEEFINEQERYCLWLKGISPAVLKNLPEVLERVENVRKCRLSSRRSTTNALANIPMLFGEIRQPETDYLAIPEVSSERRRYIPIGFVSKDVIASNKIYTMRDSTLYHFGVLSSAMHMAWTRAVCGRLKSDYQYSSGIVYNNFPWPESVSDRQKKTIEVAAQLVLATRAKYPDSSLADLYDPLATPIDLTKAHNKLDDAVDEAYTKRRFAGDRERVAFLLDLYQQTTSSLLSMKLKRR